VANALLAKLNIKAELVAGSGGVFKVEVDGKIVAQRTREHFPDVDEIVDLVSSEI